MKKSADITTMTIEEFKIFIDDATKKSKYPDITKWIIQINIAVVGLRTELVFICSMN